MSSVDRYLLIVANLLAGLSGAAYGLIHWLGEPADELALAHPWQPAAQYVHILAAPLLVLAIGQVLYHHGVLSWRSDLREGRRSGLALLGLALPMIFSGYLLLLATGEFWRPFWIAVHVATALLWIAAFLAHLRSHTRRRASPMKPRL